jgi:hypothetical protein
MSGAQSALKSFFITILGRLGARKNLIIEVYINEKLRM